MDVDNNVPASSTTPFPASSPPVKCSKLVLPPGQLAVLNNKMNELSDAQMWQARVKKAEGDDSLWGGLFRDIVVDLTSQLAAAHTGDFTIINQTVESAERLVKSFKTAEFEEWKVGVRTGVESKDWSDIITHRTYVSDYWSSVAFK